MRVLLKAGVGDFHGFGDTVIAMALVFVMLMLMMINVMLMVTAIVRNHGKMLKKIKKNLTKQRQKLRA